MPQGSAVVSDRASIALTATDDVEIAAAATGFQHRLNACVITFEGEWTAQFKSASTAIGGAMTFQDGDSLILDGAEAGALQSTSGEALNLTLTLVSGSGSADGHASSVKVAA